MLASVLDSGCGDMEERGEFERVDREEREVKKVGEELRGKGDATRDVAALVPCSRGEPTRERRDRGGDRTGDESLLLGRDDGEAKWEVCRCLRHDEDLNV